MGQVVVWKAFFDFEKEEKFLNDMSKKGLAMMKYTLVLALINFMLGIMNLITGYINSTFVAVNIFASLFSFSIGFLILFALVLPFRYKILRLEKEHQIRE